MPEHPPYVEDMLSDGVDGQGGMSREAEGSFDRCSHGPGGKGHRNDLMGWTSYTTESPPKVYPQP